MKFRNSTLMDISMNNVQLTKVQGLLNEWFYAYFNENIQVYLVEYLLHNQFLSQE